MLLPKFLSRKISQEKSLDFWSQKSVVRPALVLLLRLLLNKLFKLKKKKLHGSQACQPASTGIEKRQ